MKCLFCALALIATAAFAQDPPHNQTNEPNQRPPNPAAVAKDAAAQLEQSGGSLLRATITAQADPQQAKLDGVSFFVVPAPEPRVMRKHDLVTIIVREESEIKTEGTSDLKKTADIDAKLEQFITFSLENFALKNAITGEPLQIKASGERNFKGEATVDRTDSMTARITGEVIDVKPNGTLVLQARKRIRADEEEQQFILTGICRAEDVSPDNTVLSTQLYDLELSKQHKGAVRDTTKRGWIPKLLDALNPF